MEFNHLLFHYIRAQHIYSQTQRLSGSEARLYIMWHHYGDFKMNGKTIEMMCRLTSQFSLLEEKTIKDKIFKKGIGVQKYHQLIYRGIH